MRNFIVFFSIFPFFLIMGCTKQEVGVQDQLEGTLIQVKFIGEVKDGTQLKIDDLIFYFEKTDTALAFNNTGTYDPFLPRIIDDEPFSVSLPASTIYRKIQGVWRAESIPNNMMPYHFAIAFNHLKLAKNLQETYALEGNTTSAILSSSFRVKNIKGDKLKVSTSEDAALEIKVIE